MTAPEKTMLAFRGPLDVTYEEAGAKVTAELKKEGFGVLTQIDIKKTLNEKIGVDFRRYAILGACNPKLAHAALSADLDVGMLLPCNVTVYEDGDGSQVSLIDPVGMLAPAGLGELAAVAEDAQARLGRVAAALAG